MDSRTQSVSYVIAGVLFGGLLACADPVVDARFDQSVISADFEGQWAQLPVESTEQSESVTETVVFKEAKPEPVAAMRAPQFPDPLFVSYPLHPTGRTVVFGVAEATGTDVVLLDNGFDQGFRTGMLCDVRNDGEPVGEIILVEVRADRAAGLITRLEPGRVIRFGDAVRIKTIQYL